MAYVLFGVEDFGSSEDGPAYLAGSEFGIMAEKASASLVEITHNTAKVTAVIRIVGR